MEEKVQKDGIAQSKSFKGITNEFSRIYKTSVFMPFGRFNSSEKAPEYDNEIYVGHEKQRTSFLKHIHNAGRNCAYLITGQRGAGKSNFVTHCLHEYAKNISVRYRNYKKSRNFMDSIFTMLFFTVIFLLPAMLTSALPKWDWSLSHYLIYFLIFALMIKPFAYQILRDYYIEKYAFSYELSLNEKFKKFIKLDIDIDGKINYVLGLVFLLIFIFEFSLDTYLILVFYCSLVSSFELINWDIPNLHPMKLFGNPLDLWKNHYDLYINEAIFAKTFYLAFFLVYSEIFSYLRARKMKGLSLKKMGFYIRRFVFDYSFAPYVVNNIKRYFILFNGVIFLGFAQKNGTENYIGVYAAILILATAVIVYMEKRAIVVKYDVLQDLETEQDLDTNAGGLSKRIVFNNGRLLKYKKYYGLLMANTWTGWYFNLWIPHIKINVNLGFDDISHKSMVYTLLAEIRQKYHANFVSWGSSIALLQRLFVISLGVICIRYSGFEYQKHGEVLNIISNDDGYKVLYISCMLGLVFYFFTYVIPIFPYRSNLRVIDNILDRLTSTLNQENGINTKILKTRSSKVFKPMSSRDVEYQFLSAIAIIQDNKTCLVGQFSQIPKPEFTIVFDEMDKLGGELRDANSNMKDSLLDETLNVSNAIRSSKIRELLSDLKNIVSSKHCRFIFIGGRHLRDEWLAEQSKRDQLLPSIFDKEIYLSSFLADRKEYEPVICRDILLYRTEEYLLKRLQQAREYQSHPEGPFYFHNYVKNTYSDYEVKNMYGDVAKRMFYLYGGIYRTDQEQTGNSDSPIFNIEEESNNLFRLFIVYIAFRSLGLPKRLEEVLASFIESKNKALIGVDKSNLNKEVTLAEDLLFFTDIDVIRVQFIYKIYNLIDKHLGRLIYNRDDKISTTLFYISDFIFKFHNRAFDRSSLERLDEIIDVHQSSDLRTMLDQLIEAFSGEILRPILNGMFEYRFTSTIASEIKYICRYSPVEAAAFNFSLDESHLLKEMHLRKMKAERGTVMDNLGLAELYEYDREYDSAISEYQRAIKKLDDRLNALGRYGDEAIEYSFKNVLTAIENDEFGETLTISNVIDWAVLRLRLMLRIGLVFEQRKNYERAGTSYHEAHIFARHILKAILTEHVMLKVPDLFVDGIKVIDATCPPTFYLAKHLSILYQAIFAKAWVAEKQVAGLDASVLIVNTELFYFEKLLPFPLSLSTSMYGIIAAGGTNSHPSFALIKSEMYKKSGDLCFYKGAGLPDSDAPVNEYGMPKNPLYKHGFLYRAAYFYSASLHYLRHFNIFRLRTSKKKYGLNHDSKEWDYGVFSAEQLSEYPLTESASSLFQFAETLISRVDLKDVFAALKAQPDGGTGEKLKHDLSLTSLISFNVYAHNTVDVWLKGFEHLTNKVNTRVEKYFGQLESVKEKNKAEMENPVAFIPAQYLSKETEYIDMLDFATCSKVTFSLIKNETGITGGGLVSEDSEQVIDSAEKFTRMWLGEVINEEQNAPVDVIIESKVVSQSSIEKIVLYIVMVNLAASWQQRSGYKQDASHEYRRGFETIVTLLEEIYLMSVLPGPEKDRSLTKVHHQELFSDESKGVFLYLVTRAVYFYECSMRLIDTASIDKNAHHEKKLTADAIPGKLMLLVLRLNSIVYKLDSVNPKFNLCPRLFCFFGEKILASNPVLTPKQIKEHSLINALKLLVEKYDGVPFFKSECKIIDYVAVCKDVSLLIPHILCRKTLLNRSTVLTRILSLQHILFSLAVQAGDGYEDIKSWELVTNRAYELLELMEQYSVNSDFLYASTGIVVTICALRGDEFYGCDDKKASLEMERQKRYLLHRCKELLVKNHELFTMRSSYYQRIGDMYYLFDDFNDRTTHHGKALQMMSSVLTCQCEAIVRNELNESFCIDVQDNIQPAKNESVTTDEEEYVTSP